MPKVKRGKHEHSPFCKKCEERWRVARAGGYELGYSDGQKKLRGELRALLQVAADDHEHVVR